MKRGEQMSLVQGKSSRSQSRTPDIGQQPCYRLLFPTRHALYSKRSVNIFLYIDVNALQGSRNQVVAGYDIILSEGGVCEPRYAAGSCSAQEDFVREKMIMALEHAAYMTVAAYLELCRTGEVRYEYVDGYA